MSKTRKTDNANNHVDAKHDLNRVRVAKIAHALDMGGVSLVAGAGVGFFGGITTSAVSAILAGTGAAGAEYINLSKVEDRCRKNGDSDAKILDAFKREALRNNIAILKWVPGLGTTKQILNAVFWSALALTCIAAVGIGLSFGGVVALPYLGIAEIIGGGIAASVALGVGASIVKNIFTGGTKFEESISYKAALQIEEKFMQPKDRVIEVTQNQIKYAKDKTEKVGYGIGKVVQKFAGVKVDKSTALAKDAYLNLARDIVEIYDAKKNNHDAAMQDVNGYVAHRSKANKIDLPQAQLEKVLSTCKRSYEATSHKTKLQKEALARVIGSLIKPTNDIAQTK